MANPLLGSLVDPFTAATLNTAVWNASSGGGVTGIAAPGRAFVQVSASYYAIGAGTYNAAGQALYAKVSPATAGTGGKGVETYLQVVLNSSNKAQVVCNPGSYFQLQVSNAGATTSVNLPAYDPAQHAWWRLRETGGSWAMDASPDGAAWTQLATLAYTWSPAAVTVYLLAGTYDGTTGSSAYFEHVNTPLGTSTLMPSWPQIRYQVAFNTGGQMTALPSYVDLSTRLRGSWSADLAGRQYELDQIQSGQLSLTLWNRDGALDPLNTSSLYYPNVVPMRSCRLQAVWPPTRNLFPQHISTASSLSAANSLTLMGSSAGTLGVATGLAPTPTGHTNAFSWTVAASTATGQQLALAASNNGGIGWPVSDAYALPVVGGLTYTFSGWVAQAAGGDTTTQLAHRISWYDQTGTRLTASVGPGTVATVVGTWAQVLYTVTAPATAVNCRPGVALVTSPSSTTTLYATALQMELAAAASPWVAGGVQASLWTGFVERWPQQWDYSGSYGLVDLTCVDLLAGLAQFTLQPSLTASLQALSPVRMMPLDEPTGSTTFRDTTGRHGLSSVARSSYGAGTVTAGSSVTGTGFVGAAGPVVTFANPTPSPVSGAGSFIQLGGGGPGGGNTSNGWSRIICFRTTTLPPSGANMALWYWSDKSLTGAQGGLYVDHNGNVNGQTQNSAGQSITVNVPTVNVVDGNWHMAAVILTPDGKTLNVNVDGVGYGGGSTNNCQPSAIIDDTLGMAVTTSQGGWFWAFSGDMAYAVDVPTNNIPSFSDIAAGFATGWAGETSAARAQRILTMAGYGGTIQTQGATIAMGGAPVAGTDPVSALTLVGDTEAGQVYADQLGQMWLTGRLWRYLQSSPTVTFGENQASGEVPYLGDVAFDFDTTHIYNAAQVTNVGAPGAQQQPMQPANNLTSQQTYLPRTIQRSINTQDPTMALAAGQYLVSQYGQPLARLAALNIDVASNPALMSTVLGLGFGTLAQVNRRPPSGPGATPLSVEAFVEHLSWAGDDQGNLKLALQLTPAAPYLGWWVVAALHTTVATASTAGTATVTLAALTGAALNPAGAVLAPGTQLTLSYGTANAETLTVLSVAATSPGYSSVAVTFTANTAHNHAVGDVVCEPLPGGYRLPAATAAGYPASLDAGATLSAAGPRVAY